MNEKITYDSKLWTFLPLVPWCPYNGFHCTSKDCFFNLRCSCVFVLSVPSTNKSLSVLVAGVVCFATHFFMNIRSVVPFVDAQQQWTDKCHVYIHTSVMCTLFFKLTIVSAYK